MTSANIKGTHWFFKISAGIFFLFALIISFQNCSGGFSQESTQNYTTSYQRTSGGGGGDGVIFDGKPTEYFRLTPSDSQLCHQTEFSSASLQIFQNAALLKSTDLESCQTIQNPVPLEDIDFSSFQKEIVGYKAGIFTFLPSTPLEEPAEYAEVWCHSLKPPFDSELLVFYRPSTNSAVLKAYGKFAEHIGNGEDTKVLRFGTESKVTVQTQNFSLVVHTQDQLKDYPGQLSGELQIRGQAPESSEKLHCRLGGYFDSHIWPAKNLAPTNRIGPIVRSSTLSDFDSDENGADKVIAYFTIEPETHSKILHVLDLETLTESTLLTQSPKEFGSLFAPTLKITQDGRFVYFWNWKETTNSYYLLQFDTQKKVTRTLFQSSELRPLFLYKDGTLVFLTPPMDPYSSESPTQSLYYLSGKNPNLDLQIIRVPYSFSHPSDKNTFSYDEESKTLVYTQANKGLSTEVRGLNIQTSTSWLIGQFPSNLQYQFLMNSFSKQTLMRTFSFSPNSFLYRDTKYYKLSANSDNFQEIPQLYQKNLLLDKNSYGGSLLSARESESGALNRYLINLKHGTVSLGSEEWNLLRSSETSSWWLKDLNVLSCFNELTNNFHEFDRKELSLSSSTFSKVYRVFKNGNMLVSRTKGGTLEVLELSTDGETQSKNEFPLSSKSIELIALNEQENILALGLVSDGGAKIGETPSEVLQIFMIPLNGASPVLAFTSAFDRNISKGRLFFSANSKRVFYATENSTDSSFQILSISTPTKLIKWLQPNEIGPLQK